MVRNLAIGSRKIGPEERPLVIAEIGINHEGILDKAIGMVDAAYSVGCECVKTQYHIIQEEMSPYDNQNDDSVKLFWDTVSRCSLSGSDENKLKEHIESKGMIYLSTAFSKAAGDHLNAMGVKAFKIGSGECNNYAFVKYIASFGKPVLLSTGMNDLESVELAVGVLRDSEVPFVVMHCTSIYPTPYNKARLGALKDLSSFFPDAVLGFSDHSVGNYACYGAVAFGACVIEKHFTSDKAPSEPDILVSIGPDELGRLITGTRAVHEALGGHKNVLRGEYDAMKYARGSVVATRAIEKGERLTEENTGFKRPGTGEIPASLLSDITGCIAKVDIEENSQIKRSQIRFRK
ncbi:MAG: N-acetylneuraminate synthase family protein [Planctomycetota bacterium]|jgi:N-acetylneuraminate synthase